MNNDNYALVTELSTPIYQARGWMKLVGVLMIVYGVMVALSIIGIIVAWLPIWMGVLLFQSASNADQAKMNGDQMALYTSLGKLKTYFTIMGIMSLLSIIMTIVFFALGLTGALVGLSGTGTL